MRPRVPDLMWALRKKKYVLPLPGMEPRPTDYPVHSSNAIQTVESSLIPVQRIQIELRHMICFGIILSRFTFSPVPHFPHCILGDPPCQWMTTSLSTSPVTGRGVSCCTVHYFELPATGNWLGKGAQLLSGPLYKPTRRTEQAEMNWLGLCHWSDWHKSELSSLCRYMSRQSLFWSIGKTHNTGHPRLRTSGPWIVSVRKHENLTDNICFSVIFFCACNTVWYYIDRASW